MHVFNDINFNITIVLTQNTLQCSFWSKSG